MLTSEVRDRIARITLAHPPVNALSRAWADAFFRILDDLQRRADWNVLHLRSNQRVFSAGGDIKAFAARLDHTDAGDLLAEEAASYQQLFLRIETMPQISVVELEGAAVGGGLELALACDLRIASESARLGLSEVGLGLLPSAGGTQRMAKLCGRGTALRLIGLSEIISGVEAHRLGLVEWVVSSHSLAAQAEDIVSRLAAQPREALIAAKSCIAAVHDPQRDGYQEELAAPRRLMALAETRERILAFVNRPAKSRR